jgi:hypothetical protein
MPPRPLTIKKLERCQHLQIALERISPEDLERCITRSQAAQREWHEYDEPIAVGQSWPTRVLGDREAVDVPGWI